MVFRYTTCLFVTYLLLSCSSSMHKGFKAPCKEQMDLRQPVFNDQRWTVRSATFSNLSFFSGTKLNSGSWKLMFGRKSLVCEPTTFKKSHPSVAGLFPNLSLHSNSLKETIPFLWLFLCESSHKVRYESLIEVGKGVNLWYEDMYRKCLPLDSNTVSGEISKPEQNISWIPKFRDCEFGGLPSP